jgi:hypothetical protein
MDVPPNQTVYLNNLNDSVQKEGEGGKESVRFSPPPFELPVALPHPMTLLIRPHPKSPHPALALAGDAVQSLALNMPLLSPYGVTCTDLRRTLYGLCSQFGPILDVVARKTKKTRGQAFVVFRVGLTNGVDVP